MPVCKCIQVVFQVIVQFQECQEQSVMRWMNIPVAKGLLKLFPGIVDRFFKDLRILIKCGGKEVMLCSMGDSGKDVP